MRRAVIVLAASLAVPLDAAAQRSAAPARPRLDPGADTNSAMAYHQFGVRRLRQNPREAAAAFYWASRLNPESSSHLYGRWIAMVIAQPELLNTSRRGDGRRAAEARALDSLRNRSLMLDPFLHRNLDDQLVLELAMRSYGGTVGGDIEAALTRIMELDPDAAALVNYSRGQLDATLEILGRQAKREPRNAYLRMELGRTHVLRGALDSGRVNIDSAITLARRRDADSTRSYYEQKSTWEYSLGRVLAMQGRPAQAREAFERALLEDLSYHPAHIQLGMLHLQQGDSAAAMREFGRAVEAREDEYLPRITYGWYLSLRRQPDSALVHLRRAAELEPWAAAPRLILGTTFEAVGDTAAALTSFEEFMQRAAMFDPNMMAARSRVQQLRAARR